MIHRATPNFWKCFDTLPVEVQLAARRAFNLLCEHPHHPSLHLKRIREIWSVRIGLHYRALAIESENIMVWFWIGSHADYDHMIK